MMKPLKFINSEGLLLEGCLIKNDGNGEWSKWEEMDSKESEDVRYAHHHLINGSLAHEVRFYPEDGEYVFTGLEVTREINGTLWEYIKVPPINYAVFEIDYKLDIRAQFNAIDTWLDENKDTYQQMEWNADGRIDSSIFVLCLYDHNVNGKFGQDSIMEMWIPLVKTNE